MLGFGVIEHLARRASPTRAAALALSLLATGGLTGCHAQSAQSAPAGSWRQARTIGRPGCNADSFAQVPGSTDLFFGRYMLNAQGQISPGMPKDDCSGGKTNHWALTLDRFDWQSGQMSVEKVLVDTSQDPYSGQPAAMVTGGAMQGGLIKTAYDPSAVVYGGRILVAFECGMSNGAQFGIKASSACIGVYNPQSQTMDFSRTKAVIAGHDYGDHVVSASTPKLLAYNGGLYIYWSSVLIDKAPIRFLSIAVRGAQLKVAADGQIVTANGRADMYSDAGPVVWSAASGDPLSDTTVDVRQVWADNGGIYAMVALGGSGCTSPAGGQPGCYRLAMGRADRPIGNQVFHQLKDVSLPTNAGEYSQVVHDPHGGTVIMGGYFRPTQDGVSDRDPAPAKEVWDRTPGKLVLLMYPVDLNALER